MPKQMRWKIKQDCEVILNEVSKAGNKIEELFKLYSEAGKEQEAEMLKMALDAVIYFLIKVFRDTI
jgi:hypothetical protein